MPCPPMDATSSVAASAKKKMSRGAEKKKKKPSRSSSSSSSSSWVARSMGLYHHSSTSSKKSIAQPPPVTVTVTETEGKNNNNSDNNSNGGDGKKKKRSISMGRSITCAGSSFCSTKESSVMSRRDDHDRGGSASSRSLRAPDLDVVDAVYASAAAAISATSSFNSDTTTATAATTVTTTTSSSSPLSSPLSSIGSSFRGVPHIRKLSSGCYECHSVFDPRSFSAAAAVTFPCGDCDEVFHKAESLELHRATRHAVLELGPEDTSRNIVEIIFQSSWLMRKQQQAPAVCRIERILKVQISDRTVKRFEQYKESIRERASSDESKKNPRCVADGNELLRFHCTTFTCSLGRLAGRTALCRASPSSSAPQCNLCSIIRDGFRVDGAGKIATMATSGRAHDMAAQVVSSDSDVRAMLVCRVVAGRVKRASDDDKSSEDDDGDFDSVSTSMEGVYSDLDELFVFNPRAILPCFVVIYSGY